MTSSYWKQLLWLFESSFYRVQRAQHLSKSHNTKLTTTSLYIILFLKFNLCILSLDIRIYGKIKEPWIRMLKFNPNWKKSNIDKRKNTEIDPNKSKACLHRFFLKAISWITFFNFIFLKINLDKIKLIVCSVCVCVCISYFN